ncbi:LOW QUALITY PROTEIN: polyprotein [Phytophthora megakarya]|uniref:Polyprotein n=1 Tax=Phytophthora megakarya TaxID=4795 RepID=A0A225UIT9_9STRA|nr:LOW QUALITY PROTEIN: polyprotein [Phytophthora megakarya]
MNAEHTVSNQLSSQQEKDAMKPIPYRQAVGSVMYVNNGTRPDIAFYMRKVSQFLANPGMERWKAVVRGLKYLSGTEEYGLLLGGSLDITTKNLADLLIAYCDSDYANCPDTRRSVGGYVTMLAKAEYFALCHCMKEMIFLKLLLKELGFTTTKPNTIYEGNQSCMKVCYNLELHGRSKHIHVRFCFVHEKVNDTNSPSLTATQKK